MKLALILMAALLLAFSGASAEENAEKLVEGLDLEALQEAAGEDLDVRGMVLDLATGKTGLDPEALANQAWKALERELREGLLLLPGLVLPALMGAITGQLIRKERAGNAARYVAGLAAALSGAGLVERLLEQAAKTGRAFAALAEALIPVLAGLLAATGSPSSAAMLSPLSSLASRGIIGLFCEAGIPLCGICAAVAVAGNLNPRLSLGNLFSLIRGAVNWTAGAIMTGFFGLASVRGLLGKGYDSASVRAARYAVDNLLPVIGGDVADGLDALLASAGLVKNAVGVTGLILLARIFTGALLPLAAGIFSLRLASAMTEPLGEEGISRMCGQFAQALESALAITAGCAVLVTLLVGTALTAGRGILS